MLPSVYDVTSDVIKASRCDLVALQVSWLTKTRFRHLGKIIDSENPTVPKNEWEGWNGLQENQGKKEE